MSHYSPTELQAKLSECFDPTEVKWKPQTVRNNRALAIAYIDARCVMDRLDDVLGVGGWQDSYVRHADGTVECTLRLRIDGEWISRTDVGSESEQTDVGDRAKAAYSDALKRAAVKFGIGRYLYRLPHQWVDFDAAKKTFVAPPRLPAWAMPTGANEPAKTATKPTPQPSAQPTQTPQPSAQPALQPQATGIPTTGEELHKRLREADAQLAAKGLISLGALLAHVTAAGVQAGHSKDINSWNKAAIELAITEVRNFKAKLASKPMATTPAPTQAPSPKPRITPQDERDLLELLHSMGRGWSEDRTRTYLGNLLGITIANTDHISVLTPEQHATVMKALRSVKDTADAKKAKKKTGAA